MIKLLADLENTLPFVIFEIYNVYICLVAVLLSVPVNLCDRTSLLLKYQWKVILWLSFHLFTSWINFFLVFFFHFSPSSQATVICTFMDPCLHHQTNFLISLFVCTSGCNKYLTAWPFVILPGLWFLQGSHYYALTHPPSSSDHRQLGPITRDKLEAFILFWSLLLATLLKNLMRYLKLL